MEQVYPEFFDEFFGGQVKETGATISKILESSIEFKSKLLDDMDPQAGVPLGNVIKESHNQGILLEETTSAEIYSNIIQKN